MLAKSSEQDGFALLDLSLQPPCVISVRVSSSVVVVPNLYRICRYARSGHKAEKLMWSSSGGTFRLPVVIPSSERSIGGAEALKKCQPINKSGRSTRRIGAEQQHKKKGTRVIPQVLPLLPC